jgi:hypothetical protein
MFDSIGLSKFIKVVLYLNAILATTLISNSLNLLPEIPYGSAISVSVIAVTGLLFVIGDLLFPCLCRLPIVWRLFPNIDGEYEVEVSSNWTIINARMNGSAPEISADGEIASFKKMGTAKITSRLMRIDIELTMDDRYLTSESVVCSLRRERGERYPVLFYIYESHVAAPKNTDSARHMGAARVRIPLERCPGLLEGNYWTDRNWHQGLNTAGRIRMRRK